MSDEALHVVGTILAHEMNLISEGEKSQVMYSYQRFNIPEQGLYIALSYVGPSRIISNMNSFSSQGKSLTAGIKEERAVVMLYAIQIDIMSFDSSARRRFVEIPMALLSIYAEGLMEQNNMQIARMPSPFIDAASLEVTKFLNRFVTTISVQAMHLQEKTGADYFNRFPFQINRNGVKSQVLYPEDPNV